MLPTTLLSSDCSISRGFLRDSSQRCASVASSSRSCRHCAAETRVLRQLALQSASSKGFSPALHRFMRDESVAEVVDVRGDRRAKLRGGRCCGCGQLVERAQEAGVAAVEHERLRLRRAVDQLGEKSGESITEIASVHGKCLFL